MGLFTLFTLFTSIPNSLSLRRRGIVEKKTFTWDDLAQWTKTAGNPDNYGRGSVGNRAPFDWPSACIEVQRKKLDGGWQVFTYLILEPSRGYHIAQQQEWRISKFDAKIEKHFGDNYRFRIDR